MMLICSQMHVLLGGIYQQTCAGLTSAWLAAL